MYCFDAIRVLSSLIPLIKQREMKLPMSFSAFILSAKSGIGKFSGSFLLYQVYQAASFLVIESGSSLKKVNPDSWAKLCLDNARILSHILSVSQGKLGLLFSDLISRPYPDFKKIETSLLVITFAVWLSFKQIRIINVFLCCSKRPLCT